MGTACLLTRHSCLRVTWSFDFRTFFCGYRKSFDLSLVFKGGHMVFWPPCLLSRTLQVFGLFLDVWSCGLLTFVLFFLNTMSFWTHYWSLKVMWSVDLHKSLDHHWCLRVVYSLDLRNLFLRHRESLDSSWVFKGHMILWPLCLFLWAPQVFRLIIDIITRLLLSN